MRKSIVVALILGLLIGALAVPADAGKKKKKKPARIERVEEIEYKGGGIGAATPAASGGFCPFDTRKPPEDQPVCIELPTTGDDLFVKVEVQDTAGQKVAGFVSQGDTDGDGVGDLFGDFCGAHEEPVPITPGPALRVSFYNGVCDDGTPSLVTQGTIKVSFSNLP